MYCFLSLSLSLFLHSPPIFSILIFKRILSLLRRRNTLDLFYSYKAVGCSNETRLDGGKKFVHAKTRPSHLRSFVIQTYTCSLFAGNQLVVDNRLTINIEMYVCMMFSPCLYPSAWINDEHHHVERIFQQKHHDKNDDDNNNSDGSSHLTKNWLE